MWVGVRACMSVRVHVCECVRVGEGCESKHLTSTIRRELTVDLNQMLTNTVCACTHTLVATRMQSHNTSVRYKQ